MRYVIALAIALLGSQVASPASAARATADVPPYVEVGRNFALGLKAFAAKQRAHASFRKFARSSERLRKEYKSAKAKRAIGYVSVVNKAYAAGNALEYGLTTGLLNMDGAHWLEKLVMTGATIGTTIYTAQEMKLESRLRRQARTELVARALARGEGPSRSLITQWLKAGLIRPIRR
jgi:hypothetical protein